MKKILIVLGILIIILIALSSLMKKGQISNAVLLLTSVEGKEFPLSEKDLSERQLLNTSKGNYSAISLKTLLEKKGIGEFWQKITFYSSDGAEVTILKEENAELYLAKIEKDESFYLRLIIPSDPFPQRWLKYINRITLK